MSDVTRILEAVDAGDRQAAGELLPLVYAELRKLASSHMAMERADHTLDATALVHEAYLRLVGPLGAGSTWNGRGHFFAAASEAMRRILVEHARGRQRAKREGSHHKHELADHFALADGRVEEILVVHDLLDELARHDGPAAELVKLRFFAGFSHQEAADALGLGRRAADRLWLLARTWLYQAMQAES